MSIHSGHDDESDEGEVFINPNEVIQVIDIDSEELPGQDEELDSDDEMDEFYTVACNPTNTSLVATGGKNNKGFLWKIGPDGASLELQGHSNTVCTVAFSFDGQLLATGSFDGLIHVWDTSSGSLKCTLKGSGKGFEWLRWHPRGHLIIAGSEDKNVWMWNVDKGSCLNTFSVIIKESRVVISHMMVISSLISHSDSVECIGLRPSVPWAATGGMDQKLIVWDLQRSSVRRTCDHEGGVTCLTWLGTSHFVATGCTDGNVRIWNSLSGNCVRIYSGHTNIIQALAVSADGNFLVSVSIDGTARVFDLRVLIEDMCA